MKSSQAHICRQLSSITFLIGNQSGQSFLSENLMVMQSTCWRLVSPHRGKNVSRLTTLPLIFALAFTLSGCPFSSSDQLKRYPLSGTVTFQGKPVPKGDIYFEPDSKAGNSGPASNGYIENSQYKINKEHGVVGGAYIVRIKGYAEPVNSGGPIPTLRGAPLFPEYVTNVELPLKAAEQNFEIPAHKK